MEGILHCSIRGWTEPPLLDSRIERGIRRHRRKPPRAGFVAAAAGGSCGRDSSLRGCSCGPDSSLRAGFIAAAARRMLRAGFVATAAQRTSAVYGGRRRERATTELAGDGGDLDVCDLCGAGAGADARLPWRSRPPPPPRPGHGAHTPAMALASTSATAPAAVLKTPFLGSRRTLPNAAAPKPAPHAPRRRRGRRQEVVDPPSSSTRPGSTDRKA
jgi:hypothetical protein